MNVSVLLLTHNEERNLPRCLQGLAWCDDVVIVDSGSIDRTVEIALAWGARILERPFNNFAEQRNFGLTHGNLRHEWVLHLDADEVVTPEFHKKLSMLEPAANIDGYRIPAKLMLGDHWLRYSGMYPTYQVRLGHRDRLRFVQAGHGQREILDADRIATFDEPYLHYNFSQGVESWFRKHLRYAQDEARLLVEERTKQEPIRESVFASNAMVRRRTLKRLTGRIPLTLRPFARMFYILIIRAGFRDGRDGLRYALMLAVYEGMISTFALQQIESRPWK